MLLTQFDEQLLYCVKGWFDDVCPQPCLDQLRILIGRHCALAPEHVTLDAVHYWLVELVGKIDAITPRRILDTITRDLAWTDASVYTGRQGYHLRELIVSLISLLSVLTIDEYPALTTMAPPDDSPFLPMVTTETEAEVSDGC
jgi:hypothetical protein